MYLYMNVCMFIFDYAHAYKYCWSNYDCNYVHVFKYIKVCLENNASMFGCSNKSNYIYYGFLLIEDSEGDMCGSYELYNIGFIWYMNI